MSVMYSPVLKYSHGVLRKGHEMISNINHHQHQDQNHHHQQQQQQNSRLLRYRSAPSSFLENLVDINNGGASVNEDPPLGHGCYHHIPSTSSSSEAMFSKPIQSNNGWSRRDSEPVQVQEEYGGSNNKPTVLKEENGNSSFLKEQNGYPYWTQQIQSLPTNNNGYDGSFGVVNSVNSDHSTQSEMGVRSCSNLIRQKSSPAGFFSSENALREVERFRSNDVSSNRSSSCLKRMPQIAEYENESHEGNLVNDNGSSKYYVPSFTGEVWDASSFNSQKAASADEIMFSASTALESQDSDFCSQNLGLIHHLSLLSSSTKMGSMEKFLQLQGTVPCKIRAKRGFATHPRSIAERVRRTRISERIKKLQGLFPKSDKQTSTAEMLDLAVEHIKELQEQVKMLTNIRSKCRCTNTQKQYS
ncbi:transcription factor bHLH130 [Arachis duranensis]|uniref:Transcription factor bHLH130 n=1 Tax=Arachis duranensis TaxID=130453 RepID=A0A6P4BXC8_ARADU|nr:transcription factor bHLH130 [Arachis duranensis]